jgi:hypothetical protein
VVILETLAARVEENLLGCHVVEVEKSGEDTGLLVDTLLSPELLEFGEIRDSSCDRHGQGYQRG